MQESFENLDNFDKEEESKKFFEETKVLKKEKEEISKKIIKKDKEEESKKFFKENEVLKKEKKEIRKKNIKEKQEEEPKKVLQEKNLSKLEKKIQNTKKSNKGNKFTKLKENELQSYKIIFILKNVDPKDPIEELSTILRNSRVNFEIEKIERFLDSSNKKNKNN